MILCSAVHFAKCSECSVIWRLPNNVCWCFPVLSICHGQWFFVNTMKLSISYVVNKNFQIYVIMSKEDEEYWKCFKNNMIWGISENSQQFWFLVPQWWRSIYVENLETLRQRPWGSNFELGDWANPVSWDSDTGWGNLSFISVSPDTIPGVNLSCGHMLFVGTSLGLWVALNEGIESQKGSQRWSRDFALVSTLDRWPYTHCFFTFEPQAPPCPQPCRGEGSPSPRREKQVSVFLPRPVLWKAVQRFLSLWWGYILINPP